MISVALLLEQSDLVIPVVSEEGGVEGKDTDKAGVADVLHSIRKKIGLQFKNEI